MDFFHKKLQVRHVKTLNELYEPSYAYSPISHVPLLAIAASDFLYW